MYIVQTLYDLEDNGIGSDVQLYTNPNTAIQQAKEAKDKHIRECYLHEEYYEDEQIDNNEIYSCTIQGDDNFWNVIVKTIIVQIGD
ncbi:hypothetical protein [Bacillus atrophaeus]|uniref:hypothetical protein n=1 Tax=Bacillus atrophaeus TaxID=1452 RepID=UPI00077AF895|nr:hypothetical protein [Bacillus atrophaeus]KXZ13272.1 hypothetical protein AXI57_16080 [Bacillus atrophaeus]MED4806318.1 hypothetical protein [Bacillus atrophaeus]UFD97650.1 hypothetical protein [Bacillus atrophaeus]GED04455.1 hypothetical protein BAT02nite_40990 [Bacillus atrophaeus]